MPSAPFHAKPIVRWLLLLLAASILAACQTTVGGTGARVNSGAPVTVALLLPYGSDEVRTEALAASLENAARMAISDLQGAQIDLRVYNTAGHAETAAAAARQAVSDGASIILGPLFAESANAVGSAVAGQGINVLSFSNNTGIAGGNVFVLGNTFENTAERLVNYAAAHGRTHIMIVHADSLSGRAGRHAVERAVAGAGAATGAFLTGEVSYEFSQQGVIDAISPISDTAKETETNAILFTSDTAGALPILTQLLPERMVGPPNVQFIGLTRWDIPAQTLALTGLQGGWFAMPDPLLSGRFATRFESSFGQAPHPLAGLAYDGIAAIGALMLTGQRDPLGAAALTQPSGFAGVGGIFRLRPDGTNQRALAVAQIKDNKVVIIDPAPRSFRAAGL